MIAKNEKQVRVLNGHELLYNTYKCKELHKINDDFYVIEEDEKALTMVYCSTLIARFDNLLFYKIIPKHGVFIYEEVLNRVSKDKTKYFKFLPLLQWSLENLFYYGKYAPECDPFLQKVVIHVFRLHLQYANEMLVLMHREDSLYTASHAFGKEQEFDAKKDLKEDAPYCSFSEDLQSCVNLQRYTHLNKERVQSVKKSNLLYSIYRIEKLVDIYKVPGYFHTINDSDLERALNAVNHVSNVFSVDNIKATLAIAHTSSM